MFDFYFRQGESKLCLDILSHLNPLRTQIKCMTRGFQILDIRQCKVMIPERRGSKKGTV